MVDETVVKDIEQLRDKIVELFSKSRDHKPALLSMLCSATGAIIALVSRDESDVLDGVDLAHKQIREHAAEAFVKAQKIIKELKQ